MNLNRAKIPAADDESEDESNGDPLRHHSARSSDGSVEVFFRNLQDRLLVEIDAADVVLGCVAWLTSVQVLQRLAAKRGVSIIVQKEDFLRRDYGASDDWHRELRGLYTALRPTLTREDIGGILAQMRERTHRSAAEELEREWFIEDPDPIAPIRCVGIVAEAQRRAQPRMHNKFLVFAKLDESAGGRWIQPYAVWTGSYNLSATAERSFENAVLLKDPDLVHAYYSEYCQIAALSEPLDWTSTSMTPEWWREAESDWNRFNPLG